MAEDSVLEAQLSGRLSMKLGRVAKFSHSTTFPTLDTYSYRLTLTHGENGFWKCTRNWPADQGCGAGRPHFWLAGLRPCATSSLHVILSVNTPGFGHN
jgi:hypothetical protein